jgi:hypothetical protein
MLGARHPIPTQGKRHKTPRISASNRTVWAYNGTLGLSHAQRAYGRLQLRRDVPWIAFPV